MFNKLYTRFKNFIKGNYKFLIFLVVFTIAMTVRLPWSIYAPGGTIDVRERMTGDIKDKEGSLYLTYVSFIEGTIPTLLLANILPEWDIISNADLTLEGEEFNDSLVRDRIYLYESVSNATYVAYTAAEQSIDIENTKNYVTYILDDAITDLQVGDIILSYNEIPFSEFEQFQEYIGNQEIGDRIDLLVERNGKEINCYAEIIEITDLKKIGLTISTVYDFSKNPDITYSYDTSESGSSGGLMLALSFYNSLIDEDITGGKKISGTGTIDLDGNVGEIGGVKYKLVGAVREGSDVFIVPSDNYEEAKKVKEEHDYDIELIEAITFDQVLEELKKL